MCSGTTTGSGKARSLHICQDLFSLKTGGHNLHVCRVVVVSLFVRSGMCVSVWTYVVCVWYACGYSKGEEEREVSEGVSESESERERKRKR